jgi:hypothetical protein
MNCAGLHGHPYLLGASVEMAWIVPVLGMLVSLSRVHILIFCTTFISSGETERI